jgi:hypothetical protein
MATRDEIAQALIDAEFAQFGAPGAAPIGETPLAGFVPTVSPAELAARRLRQQVQPVGGRQSVDRFSSDYPIEPDLTATQMGEGVSGVPAGYAVNDAGQVFDVQTGAPLPVTPRPNVLPLTRDPSGKTIFAMPRMGDLASNLGGGWAAPAQGGAVLGAGGARRARRAQMGDLADVSGGAAAEIKPLAAKVDDVTGSLNPLHDVDVTLRGKWPKDWTPEEFQEFGRRYGVENLGPATPPVTYQTTSGKPFTVPGGTEGTWTYYDLLSMKKDPFNPSEIDRGLHTALQQKLGRTMTPEPLTDPHVWSGLTFGMTSPNNPLFPNQLSASRLRMRSPEFIDELAGMIPWKVGDKVDPATRMQAGNAIAERLGLQAAEKGGLGTRGSADYASVAELAQMFKINPEFFRKLPNEDWGQAVERISSQVNGLKMKTGSFGTVWQDPYHAAISAIDRHMAKELDRRGGLFASAEEKTVWENEGVRKWNVDHPDNRASSWSDLTQKSGFDGFLTDRLLAYVNATSQRNLRTASGEISTNIPEHLQRANWAVEPKQVNIMGGAYKRALAENQKAADEHGLNLFMSQWLEWDRIRQRFEPHENMFPGLERLPAPSMAQLREVDKAHMATGHKTYTKTEGSLPPTRAYPGSAAEFAYFGLLGAPFAGALAPGEERR